MSSTRADLPMVDLDQQLKEVVDRIAEVMDAERCTLFLYDEERGELWSKVLTESKVGEIRVRLGEGIAGHVMATGETVRVDDAANDPRFAARFDRASGFVTRTILCHPLVNVHGRRIGVVQVLNKRGGRFSDRDTELLAALTSQATIAIENARLYQDLRAARETEAELARRLAAQHAELQDAYRRQEETKDQLEAVLRRAQRLRVAVSAGAILLFVALGLASWRLGGSAGSIDAAAARPGSGEPITLVARPLEVRLPLTGRLEPLAMSAVVAPIAGTIKHVWYHPGERVERGQRLLELDTTQVEVELRNARAAVIKAERHARDLHDWASGTEVAEAKRRLSKAKMSLDASQESVVETKVLFDKGIVGRSEYEGVQRDAASQELDYKSAQQDLEDVMDQGNAENVGVAEMELENARVNLSRVEARLAQAVVVAPAAGVVIRPAGAAGELGEGGKVEAGEALLAIGDLSSLAAVASADELEVERLRLGQSAVVTSEAFPGVRLHGTVRSVAAAAGAGGGFTVVVAVPTLPPEAASQFRLGLTARIEAVVYQRADALLVPIAAVEAADGGEGWVEVLDPATGKPVRRKVVLGETTVTDVEVREGLAAGDRVLVPRW
jgi:multidrug resistance efflux pump/putative methionine-R-sulfoxide reductase with GAF domain